MADSTSDSSPEKRAGDEKTLLITGFGPFGQVQVNPSWEVAKAVQVPGVRVVREHLDVEYDHVDLKVPELWEKHKPDFVIHCGVSAIAEGLVFEKVASCGLYTRKDVKGCVPSSCGEEESLCTQVDVCAVVDHLNCLLAQGQITIPSFTSTDAGRYLCEYVYSRSLLICPGKTVFIHIPSDAKFSVQESTKAVQHAIAYLLLKDKE